MNCIKTDDRTYKDGKITLDLGDNKKIKKVVVFFDAPSDDIRVKYAQNNVTSDLITFCDKNYFDGAKLIYTVGEAVTASHICVVAQETDISELRVDIFEEEEELVVLYPEHKDKDLCENYYLDTITVSTVGNGEFVYSIYTSMDGRDFDFLAKKRTSCVDEVIPAGGREARIIRVYFEYCDVSGGDIDEIGFTGNRSNTPVKEYPRTEVVDFEDSQYNVEIKPDDTYDEVYGIIERRIGSKYKEWFKLTLAENPRKGHIFDYFELSSDNGKILIKGNSGVSLAVGLNYYLKYCCNINISQVGDQIKMPEEPMVLPAPIFKETKAKLRYAYNYCTLSYTMAFWGADEWRRELDWLALNGVNLVLDITAQEEVWRRFLMGIGYSHKEIKSYLTGPAYYAWAYMANIYHIGGPVHDNWFSERTELARRNHLAMRKLGMYPILQGYSGMVPVDIEEYDKNTEIIPQGIWGGSQRPYMLRTTSPCYKEYAKRFYQCQREVYGDYSFYFATDPFHEGGKAADMKPREISEEVIGAMLRENPNAVWVIQSWQGNPSSELLKGLESVKNGKEHALILDLYAEKTPHYTEGKAGNPCHGYSGEFDNTPWIYCMLNNFGGRLGLHGHLDNLVKNVPIALNTTKKNYGIGITPEASENNPVLYEFLFESIWQDDADFDLSETDIDEWLKNYSIRRYGAKSDAAIEAWDILKNTVYKAESNMIGQGAPECVINARPDFEIQSASSWGNSIIGYDTSELERALKLLAQDYDTFKDGDAYMYDLVSLTLQVLSNKALACHKTIEKLFNDGNAEGFKSAVNEILKIADKMDDVAGANKYYMLGRWTEAAKRLASSSDDFTKRVYQINARAQITTWNSVCPSLHDYSNRQWSGLIKDFYKPRWESWINARINELEGRPFEENIDWFAREWNWVLECKKYSDVPKNIDIKGLIDEL